MVYNRSRSWNSKGIGNGLQLWWFLGFSIPKQIGSGIYSEINWTRTDSDPTSNRQKILPNLQNLCGETWTDCSPLSDLPYNVFSSLTQHRYCMSESLKKLADRIGGTYVEAADNTSTSLDEVGPADLPEDVKNLLLSRFTQTSYYKFETKFPGGLLLRVTFQTGPGKLLGVRVENGPNESQLIGLPNWPQAKLKSLVGLVSRLDKCISEIKSGV
jgi:hypothetical protein